MFKAQNHKSIFEGTVDHPRKFPEEVKHILAQVDLSRILSKQSPSKILSKLKDSSQTVLDFLFEVGRGNLSMGRIIEGHINALLLIAQFGTKEQKEKYFQCAKKGDLFGIWNTEQPKESLKLIQKEINYSLKGIKSFCSGGLNLDFAIITAEFIGRHQMLIIDLKKNNHLEEDWSLWNPIGMRASVSCRIDFKNTSIKEEDFLGKADAYYKDPSFTWGGVRFSAVQLGGAQAIFDEVIKDLGKRKRASDPYQKKRLGKMAILMTTGKFWITEAERLERDSEELPDVNKVNFANMMRSVTLNICEEVISIAEKAVGIQGVMISHPLEQKIRDLRVYLKQAGPDAALASIGDFVAATKK